MAERPYDERGRFVPLACPHLGCDGKLVREVHHGWACWRCDGLIDPDDVSKPLDACEFQHVDGERYEAPRA